MYRYDRELGLVYDALAFLSVYFSGTTEKGPDGIPCDSKHYLELKVHAEHGNIIIPQYLSPFCGSLKSGKCSYLMDVILGNIPYSQCTLQIVVILKEVRRTMRINEGDPLEIFTGDGQIIFQKYSVIENIGAVVKDILDALYRTHQTPVMACDKEKIVAIKGIPKNEIINRRITDDMTEMMERRKAYAYDGDSGSPCFPVEGIERYAAAFAPIIASGDIVGALIFLSPDICRLRRRSIRKPCSPKRLPYISGSC